LSISAGQLSCQELVELVTAYFEGALEEPERALFEEHIGRCEGCGRYVEQMQATLRLTGELRPADLSREAQRKLLDAFRDWSAPS
jgi:anti-sigma factor RsiW